MKVDIENQKEVIESKTKRKLYPWKEWKKQFFKTNFTVFQEWFVVQYPLLYESCSKSGGWNLKAREINLEKAKQFAKIKDQAVNTALARLTNKIEINARELVDLKASASYQAAKARHLLIMTLSETINQMAESVAAGKEHWLTVIKQGDKLANVLSMLEGYQEFDNKETTEISKQSNKLEIIIKNPQQKIIKAKTFDVNSKPKEL